MDTERSCRDYVRVEQALKFISENYTSRPSLKTIAAASGLSEYHFQRVFTRWAGVSPARFMRYLSKEHVRAVLRKSNNLLDAACQSGISGPGRLHDLIVSTEAVTPGQLKNNGEGIEIIYGLHPSPFGKCLIALTRKGICHLSFTGGSEKEAVNILQDEWCKASLLRDQTGTAELARRIFQITVSGDKGYINLHLKGTNFQLKVWEALLRIPPGFVVSYEDVASLAGRPDAVRATASAVARNPVSYLIPCHRVIRKMGVINNYRWGKEKKIAILGHELTESGEIPE